MCDKLEAELVLFDASTALITTNLRIRRDGRFHANNRPTHPGVSVYVTRDEQDFVFTCDRYASVWENIHGITHTIDALRTIGRHGSVDMARRSVQGFEVLPARTKHAGRLPESPWRQVLGVSQHAQGGAALDAARRRYRELVSRHHPDRGGERQQFQAITRAYQAAVAELTHAST